MLWHRAQESIPRARGGLQPAGEKAEDDLIIVPSLCTCFGEEEGEQLFSFLREEQEATRLILQSVTFRRKAQLCSEDFKWL